SHPYPTVAHVHVSPEFPVKGFPERPGQIQIQIGKPAFEKLALDVQQPVAELVGELIGGGLHGVQDLRHLNLDYWAELFFSHGGGWVRSKQHTGF
ncbi:hypothetical protein CMI47_20000, partial [Candidatus Pacearchaeota archaeon]|nr:hypothetical protein [Candidatus Pacearchaeota archaeon]